MTIICWNVRGLRNPRAVRRLHAFLKSYNLQIIFLMETKIDKLRMEGVKRKCGFKCGINVAAERSRGGLCLA